MRGGVETERNDALRYRGDRAGRRCRWDGPEASAPPPPQPPAAVCRLPPQGWPRSPPFHGPELPASFSAVSPVGRLPLLCGGFQPGPGVQRATVTPQRHGGGARTDRWPRGCRCRSSCRAATWGVTISHARLTRLILERNKPEKLYDPKGRIVTLQR
jgi:hypothetical protein